MFSPSCVPSYFLIGDRTYSVYHARIRNLCSNLNGDLHANHLRDSPSCICGYDVEDAEHYFFNCPAFRQQRNRLFILTRQFHPISINTVVFGNESLSTEDNIIIFKAVQEFIKNTCRFTN